MGLLRKSLHNGLCCLKSLNPLTYYYIVYYALPIVASFYNSMSFVLFPAGNGEPLKVSEQRSAYWELSELGFQEMNLAITWVGQTDEDWSVREEGGEERGLSWKPSEERI